MLQCTLLTIPTNNGFPLQVIHNLKDKLIFKTQKNRKHTYTNTKKEMDHIYMLQCTLLTIPRNNGFPLQVLYNLKDKLIFKTQKNRKHTYTNTKKEMDHIYMLQSTHTQSYQLFKQYRL